MLALSFRGFSSFQVKVAGTSVVMNNAATMPLKAIAREISIYLVVFVKNNMMSTKNIFDSLACLRLESTYCFSVFYCFCAGLIPMCSDQRRMPGPG